MLFRLGICCSQTTRIPYLVDEGGEFEYVRNFSNSILLSADRRNTVGNFRVAITHRIAFTYLGPFISFGFAYFGIVILICGIIAIIGAKSVTHIVWAIVLIIVGIIGGGLGGLLVILGGLIGLIAVVIKKT